VIPDLRHAIWSRVVSRNAWWSRSTVVNEEHITVEVGMTFVASRKPLRLTSRIMSKVRSAVKMKRGGFCMCCLSRRFRQ